MIPGHSYGVASARTDRYDTTVAPQTDPGGGQVAGGGMQDKPLIILTMRRTGGTALAGFLGSLSDKREITHEPFNLDRKFGHVTRRFNKTGDRQQMIADMREVLEENRSIKHCFDNVPHQITRVLIDSAVDAGYRFLLFTRKDRARRILSLATAQATGAWGSKQANDIYPRIQAGELTVAPIDLEIVRKQAFHELIGIGRVVTQLRENHIAHEWLLFEDLYGGTPPIETQAMQLATRLGFDISPDDPRLQRFGGTGGQNSVSIAEHVPNYDEAQRLLKKIFDL